MEPILYKYGVDMVFTGHTHAYEVCSAPLSRVAQKGLKSLPSPNRQAK